MDNDYVNLNSILQCTHYITLFCSMECGQQKTKYKKVS